MNSYLKQFLLLHIVVFIFGFTGILGVLITMPSNQIVVYRMGIAVVTLMIYSAFKGKSWSIPRKEWVKVAATGVLLAIHWVLFFEAIKVSTVSVTLAVLSSATLFTALIEPVLFRRKIIGYEIILGLLVISGLYIIFNFETRYTKGIILTLISAFSASLFTVINGSFAKKYNAVHISLVELAGGGVLLALYSIFSGTLFPTSTAPFSDLGYLLILGTICTAFAYVASVSVMRILTPYTVTMAINMEPVYGILLALLFFGDDEQMTRGFYIGAIIILGSVFLNGWLKKKSWSGKQLKTK